MIGLGESKHKDFGEQHTHSRRITRNFGENAAKIL